MGSRVQRHFGSSTSTPRTHPNLLWPLLSFSHHAQSPSGPGLHRCNAVLNSLVGVFHGRIDFGFLWPVLPDDIAHTHAHTREAHRRLWIMEHSGQTNVILSGNEISFSNRDLITFLESQDVSFSHLVCHITHVSVSFLFLLLDPGLSFVLDLLPSIFDFRISFYFLSFVCFVMYFSRMSPLILFIAFSWSVFCLSSVLRLRTPLLLPFLSFAIPRIYHRNLYTSHSHQSVYRIWVSRFNFFGMVWCGGVLSRCVWWNIYNLFT